MILFQSGNDRVVGKHNDDLIYALHASGSAGSPKSVEITRNALSNFIQS
ncbi:hypothetical protein J8M21_02235 [Pseudoalteromonas luteoviolacea]|nr:hypothetical protein [Pseudoalteromonas luteoviolacea]MBQ4876022.1 hypothetical protein [Pseudoalteromonas luteoviolacea]MBQ4905657.1 hypothetical protein [Pseudoalteromonas luteoviolacea]